MSLQIVQSVSTKPRIYLTYGSYLGRWFKLYLFFNESVLRFILQRDSCSVTTTETLQRSVMLNKYIIKWIHKNQRYICMDLLLLLFYQFIFNFFFFNLFFFLLSLILLLLLLLFSLVCLSCSVFNTSCVPLQPHVILI